MGNAIKLTEQGQVVSWKMIARTDKEPKRYFSGEIRESEYPRKSRVWCSRHSSKWMDARRVITAARDLDSQSPRALSRTDEGTNPGGKHVGKGALFISRLL